MINRKNHYILAGIVFVLCLAYLGILAMTGFVKHWNVWRMIAFFVLTYNLTFWPLAFLMQFYNRVNKTPTKEKIPVMKAETL
jgi:predicted membrane-bound dolichyl-phosphate-mannose-protein mannosyltransferase